MPGSGGGAGIVDELGIIGRGGIVRRGGTIDALALIRLLFAVGSLTSGLMVGTFSRRLFLFFLAFLFVLFFFFLFFLVVGFLRLLGVW